MIKKSTVINIFTIFCSLIYILSIIGLSQPTKAQPANNTTIENIANNPTVMFFILIMILMTLMGMIGYALKISLVALVVIIASLIILPYAIREFEDLFAIPLALTLINCIIGFTAIIRNRR